MSERKEPTVGEYFYTPSEEEDDEDERHEISEVLEYDEGDETWNVGSGDDFFDITWTDSRWEEVI